MNNFIDTTILPYEMISKILYEHNGIEHNNSKIINDYILNYFEGIKCFICEKNNVSLSPCPLDYIKHTNMKYIKTIILEKHNPNKINLCFGCSH